MTIKNNPITFLDTEITRCRCEIKTNVYNKFKKLPVRLSSKISTSYKCKAVTGELYRANKIATALNCEIKRITRNFIRNNNEYFNKNKDDFLFPE